MSGSGSPRSKRPTASGSSWSDAADAVVPVVTDPNDNIIPRVRIYDGADDNSYWFRRIGFGRTITSED